MRTDANVRKLLFAEMFGSLPSEVRTSVLADPPFCDKFGISPRFSFRLGECLVDTASLNNALRAAIAGHKTALLRPAEGDRFRVKLGFRKGGQATVHFQRQGFAFNDADLLSRNARTRGSALKRVFAAKPLFADEEAAWHKISRQRAFSDWEYLELMTAVGATPEALRTQLGMPGQLDVKSLIPDDPKYYERLVARLRDSRNIQSFIACELAENHHKIFERRPTHALRRIGYAALWPGLIPFDLLSSLRLSDVRALLDSKDPFSLLFCFELCCRLLSADVGFIDLGQACLEKLFDIEASPRRCHIFSAVALISMANIRRATKTSDAPVFWTRLVAVAHAGVLADALGDMPDPEKFFAWASENFYSHYRWHGIVDRRDAPRWSPDWITPDHVEAELLGRARIALITLAEGERPAEWVSAIESAVSRLADTGRFWQIILPGPFDDFHEDPNASMVPVEVFAKVEQDMAAAIYLDDVPGVAAFAYAGKLTSGAVENVVRILKRPADEPITRDGTNDLKVLQLCAHICGVSRSEPISAAIIDRCLHAVRSDKTAGTAPESLAVIIEACAAYADGRKYREGLGSAAAQLCFAVGNHDKLSDLVAVFDVLAGRDEKLVPALARAKAIALTRLKAT